MLFIMIGLFVFVLMPPLIVDGDDLTSASRIKAENDVRMTGIQALAGLALVVGAVFTAITLVYNREQQITERYTRAIDQLDHSRALDIRLGGIYALERIMRDSRRDHGAIVDVLTAFIRTHSERDEDGARKSRTSADGPGHPDADIQAALTVLGRRPARPDHELDRLRLSGTVLRGAFMRRADLRCAGLRHARLEHAHLESANLQGGRLRDAHLENADLQGALLSWASLVGAHLEGASLKEAVLDHAKLMGAAMSSETDLEDASFVGTHLAGLRGDPTFTQEQLKQAHCHPDRPTCEDGRRALPPRSHRCCQYETQGSSFYSRPRTGSPSDDADS